MGPKDRGPTAHDEAAQPSMRPSCLRRWLKNNIMLVVTLLGVLAGVALGFALRPYKLGPDALLMISYPGELFMRVLKLMILPLIIASLIAGSASLNAKMSGRIAVRTLIFFISTSMFNALLGILLAVLIHPGQPELKSLVGHAEDSNRSHHKILDSILDIGRNIFPDNIVQATFQQSHTEYTVPKDHLLTNGTDSAMIAELVRVVVMRNGTNTLGLVFFCLVFGSVLGTIGSKGQVVITFFQAVFEVIMKMVVGVMWFTPIGVGSIIAGKILGVSDVGHVMSQLVWFILTVAIGVFFYQLVIIQLIYFLFLKKNPYKFYWGLSHAILTAAATASTAAALPVTFRLMEGPLRIDPRITRFVLPIGCNIHMNGTALFLAVASIFICQMNNINLGVADLFTILLTSTAASLSSASVPSAAMVLLLVVLSAVEAPTHDISLLFAVDWLVDRIRTTNNMLGDCYAAAVVEHLSKKELSDCDAAMAELPITNGHIHSPDTDIVSIDDKKSTSNSDVTVEMHLSTKSPRKGSVKEL